MKDDGNPTFGGPLAEAVRWRRRSEARRAPPATRGARPQGAVAGHVDDPQRQSHPAQRRWREGRRASGLLCLRKHTVDGALCAHPAAGRPDRGQAARIAGHARDPLPLRPSDARKFGAVPRVRRRPVVSVAHERRLPGRFLHGFGRSRSGSDPVRVDGSGLSAHAWTRGVESAGGTHDRPDGRCRARRRQRLRSAAGGLEARRQKPVVDHRLQPAESRRRHQHVPLPKDRGFLPLGRLERRHPEIWHAPAKSLRGTGRRSAAALDRRLPQPDVLRADVRRGRGLARPSQA